MEKSKLIVLLRTFQPQELRQFKDFVSSPYFNKNEELIAFFDYLHGLAPEFPADKVEKKVVFGLLFPKEPYDSKKMSYLMNYLLKLAERFIGMRYYEDHPILEQYHILKEFLSRDLDKHFKFLYRRVEGEVTEELKESTEQFHYRHLLAELISDFSFSNRASDSPHLFQEASNSFDEYYFLNKLKYSCEMLNRQKIFPADYKLQFVTEVENYLQQDDQVSPLVAIYLRIYQYLSNEEGADEATFQTLMELIRTHHQQIDLEELRQIYLFAINFSVRNLRTGDKKYIPITLDLYLEGIRSRALFDDQYLSPLTYTNVIKLALLLQRFEWIEQFIEDHVNFLPPHSREQAYHFNLADLYYHRKDYDKVFDHLNEVQFSDIVYHLGSRVLLIKTYYEEDEIDALLSLLASFSIYLRRNKQISQGLKKTYLNFCNLLHHVLRNNPKKREAIRRQIDTTQPLAERAWLVKVWEEEK